MFLFGMNVWRNGARFQGCKISAFYPYIPPKRPSKGGKTRKNHFFDKKFDLIKIVFNFVGTKQSNYETQSDKSSD